jgi:RNA polymerase sigma-70 factor (ECF subfamily)
VAETPPDSHSDDGAAEVNGIRRRALELVSGEFESRTWQAFWRSAVEGDAPADVAADLGISVWAVYKARSRVLQRLREEFAELLED